LKERIFENTSLLEKLRYGYQFVANALFDLSCKYGESPNRVVVWSITAVIGFAVVFWKIGFRPNYNAYLIIPLPFIDYAINIPGVEYLIFSLQGYTSFLLSGGTEVMNPLIRLVATIESFTGAFLIALFVATIVRSIQR